MRIFHSWSILLITWSWYDLGDSGSADEVNAFSSYLFKGFIGLAKFYINEVVRLHGVPTLIISYCDLIFTSIFCPKLQKAMGTTVTFCFVYHPQVNSHYEQMIKTLEDMLQAYICDFQGSWDRHLPFPIIERIGPVTRYKKNKKRHQFFPPLTMNIPSL